MLIPGTVVENIPITGQSELNKIDQSTIAPGYGTYDPKKVLSARTLGARAKRLGAPRPQRRRSGSKWRQENIRIQERKFNRLARELRDTIDKQDPARMSEVLDEISGVRRRMAKLRGEPPPPPLRIDEIPFAMSRRR